MKKSYDISVFSLVVFAICLIWTGIQKLLGIDYANLAIGILILFIAIIVALVRHDKENPPGKDMN